MSWTCPDEINGHCKRLNRSCKPGSKGCVLDGKVKFIVLNSEELPQIKETKINEVRGST